MMKIMQWNTKASVHDPVTQPAQKSIEGKSQVRHYWKKKMFAWKGKQR